jgi:hypothetical protein
MQLAFAGRATRNFLLLLCMMEFVLFIDRLNLIIAAVAVTSRSTRSRRRRLAGAERSLQPTAARKMRR